MKSNLSLNPHCLLAGTDHLTCRSRLQSELQMHYLASRTRFSNTVASERKFQIYWNLPTL